MRYQLLGSARCEYSYNEPEIVGVIHEEFEADCLETAIEVAVLMLDKGGYAASENGVLKLKNPWEELGVVLREFRSVAEFVFRPAEPEQFPRPKCVIPESVELAQPGKPAMPARIEIRKV